MRRISFGWTEDHFDSTTIYCTSDFSTQANNFETSKWFFHFSHEQEKHRTLSAPLALLREYFTDRDYSHSMIKK